MDYISPNSRRLIVRISITYGLLLLVGLLLAYVCYDLIRLAFFILVLPIWYQLFNLLPVIVSSAAMVYTLYKGRVIARRETTWQAFFEQVVRNLTIVGVAIIGTVAWELVFFVLIRSY